ncbi:hypothetical protein [Ferrimonas balearica]|uniref:hypothetical protein n=1 Tax=Ferrimonas balearica TaxID=44012 RepID=UPI001C5A1BB9|nr:hypothetical protein [Ferrimonas balearica]MBW3138140.1 hypothetical protein [Ferrimonas balearica]MBY5978897.1 hypothetical protein [Ferrimonas balearica]
MLKPAHLRWLFCVKLVAGGSNKMLLDQRVVKKIKKALKQSSGGAINRLSV